MVSMSLDCTTKIDKVGKLLGNYKKANVLKDAYTRMVINSEPVNLKQKHDVHLNPDDFYKVQATINPQLTDKVISVENIIDLSQLNED